MFASAILSLVVSILLLPENDVDAKEALKPGKSTIIMVLLNALAQFMQMAALNWGSLSFMIIIKSAEPIFLLFWFKVSNNAVDSILYVSTFPIYLGVILAAGTEPRFSFIALISGLLSNVLLTGRNFFLKIAMSSERETHAAVLLFQTSLLPSIFGLVAVSLGIISGLPVLNSLLNESLIMSGMLFALMRLSSMLMLKELSLLAHSLLKLSRRAVMIAVAFVIWHSRIESLHIFGICLTILGASGAEVVKRYSQWRVLVVCYILCFGISFMAFLFVKIEYPTNLGRNKTAD